MKTNCWLALLFAGCAVIFSACQKEISYDDLTPSPRYDSITVVGSIVSWNYDNMDQFLWKSDEVYNYDITGNKTMILFRDSSSNGLNIYTETFNYDNQKRLVHFITTNRQGYFSDINFSYASNGNLDKSVIKMLDGQMVENHFSHATVNNNKVITMFDTSMIGGRYTYYRPQKIKYTFNSGNMIVRQEDIKTGPHKEPGNWYRDTFDYKFGYTPTGNVDKMTMEYTFVSNTINTPHVRDSVAFIRQSKSAALFDSYQFIYKNLYWFSFSDFANNSFANTMVHNAFYPHYLYYFKEPLETVEYHTSVSPAAYHSVSRGHFQNTFDSEGRLVKSIYPKYFANQAWGKQEIWYEYVRLRKQ